MFKVGNNGIITVSRGESFEVPLVIGVGQKVFAKRYEVEENDTIFFAVMEPDCEFEDAIIRKVYTKEDLNEEGDIVVKFVHTDTAYLLPGTYYYQANLISERTEPNEEGEEVTVMYRSKTIIDKTKFIII